MVERAKVVTVTDRFARVEIQRASACGESCGNCKGGCAPSNTYVMASNNIGASLGEYVEIELSTKTFLNAVLLTYGFPLLMFLIGVFSGSAIAIRLELGMNSDVAGILMGLGFLIVSYVLISKHDKKVNEKGSIRFEIIRVL